MKITILQGAFLPVPPKLGGAVEKMWDALGKEFANKGHEVLHISRAFKDFPNEEIIDKVHHKRVSGFATPSNGIYLKVLDLLYTLRIRSFIPDDTDVIISNTFWAPIILPTRLKRKIVVDVGRTPKGQMKFYKHAILRANSTPVADAIKNEISVIDYHRVAMIPNPLPFLGTSKIDLNSKGSILLYAGRVHPEKGLELLIDAFKMLDSNWRLQIVGPTEISAGGGGPEYLTSLKKRAENLPIEFTGPIFDMAKLNRYYHDASIFVYPSIAEKGETFGLAPLEAMGWGCVPVVSNLACFRDFIREGHNGLVFDHRKADASILLAGQIRLLQNDKDLRLKLVANALDVQNTHSTSVIASQFLTVFEKMRDTQDISKL